jgi:tetratricopeptide (TPR) repeat protein
MSRLPTMTFPRRAAMGLVWIATASACACASQGPPPRPAMPARLLDLSLPVEAPEPSALALLPALWEHEVEKLAYKVETGPLEGAGNFDALDGPLISFYARSPYVVAEGTGRERKLTTRLPSDPARPFMDAGNQAFGAGRLDEALSSYRSVIDRDPLYAKAYFYVAEIEAQRHDLEAATAWNDRGLRLSPRDAYGHALRAEIAATLGRDSLARDSLAYALALDPFSPRALKLLQQLGGGRPPGIDPPILVRVQSTPGQPAGLIARGGGHAAWQRYAICRALLTYDRRVRSEYVQSAIQSSRPGTLSLEEETTCGYMVTAVYRAARGTGPGDADLERWSRAYDSDLLREAVIYETLGCRRPEVLPLLTDDALARVAEYVRRFVVPEPAKPIAPTTKPTGPQATRNNQ